MNQHEIRELQERLLTAMSVPLTARNGPDPAADGREALRFHALQDVLALLAEIEALRSIKTRVTDAFELAKLRPEDLSAYLFERGWKLTGRGYGSACMPGFTKGEHGVGCPWHPEWADYARRVKELVEAVAREEGRSELAVLRDIPGTLDRYLAMADVTPEATEKELREMGVDVDAFLERLRAQVAATLAAKGENS